MRRENDDFLDLIRRLPRRDLNEQASGRILSGLRQAAEAQVHRSRRLKAWRISVAYFLAAVALLAVLLFPPMKKQAERTLAHWFPQAQPGPVWSVSPTFDLLDRDGTVVYPKRVRGIEGKVGFSDNGDLVAKAREPVAKMFWYVWNDETEIRQAGKKLTATAVHQDTGLSFLLSEAVLQGPINGADAHAVTSFNPFPEKGLWRIDVHIDGKLYGQIVVQVKDEYIQTDAFKFLVSKEDAFVGDIEALLVVSGDSDAETIDVRLSSLQDGGGARTIPFRKRAVFLDSLTRKPIVHYEGTLQFDRPGDWRIEALGETATVTVNER